MLPLVRQAFSGPQLRPAMLAGGLAGGLFCFIVFPALDRLHSDLLNYLLPFDVPASDSVIVAIDEPSFAAFGTGWPWPRELHGRLVEQLAALGAGQIVFDLLFAEPSEPQSDGYFAAAIAAAGTVILAADITGSDQQGRIETRPMPLFVQAGAKAGFAGVQRDPDQVVRRHPGLADTLSSLAVEPASRTLVLPDSRLLIRYVGPDHSFDYISYYRFFIDQTVPPEDLAGKTVFVGFDVRAATRTDDYRPDSFATPYTRFTGQLTPGVELHATLYHNLKHDGFVMLLAGWQKAGLLAVWVCVCGFVNAHFRPGRAILIGGPSGIADQKLAAAGFAL